MGDLEPIADVRVRRDKLTGEYSVAVLFVGHQVQLHHFSTLEGALSVSADVIRDELRGRITRPALPAVVLP